MLILFLIQVRVKNKHIKYQNKNEQQKFTVLQTAVYFMSKKEKLLLSIKIYDSP